MYWQSKQKTLLSHNFLSYKMRKTLWTVIFCIAQEISSGRFPSPPSPTNFWVKKILKLAQSPFKKSFQWIFSLGWENPETVTSHRTWEAFRRMMDTETCSFRLPRLQTVSDSRDLKISPTPFLCERSQTISGCLFTDQPAELCRALRPSPCTVT